jgi:hypothetical protein
VPKRQPCLWRRHFEQKISGIDLWVFLILLIISDPFASFSKLAIGQMVFSATGAKTAAMLLRQRF